MREDKHKRQLVPVDCGPAERTTVSPTILVEGGKRLVDNGGQSAERDQEDNLEPGRNSRNHCTAT